MFSLILDRVFLKFQDMAGFLFKVCTLRDKTMSYIRKLKELFQQLLSINCFFHSSINKEALKSETNF